VGIIILYWIIPVNYVVYLEQFVFTLAILIFRRIASMWTCHCPKIITKSLWGLFRITLSTYSWPVQFLTIFILLKNFNPFFLLLLRMPPKLLLNLVLYTFTKFFCDLLLLSIRNSKHIIQSNFTRIQFTTFET
jgi:hypothetical protein